MSGRRTGQRGSPFPRLFALVVGALLVEQAASSRLVSAQPLVAQPLVAQPLVAQPLVSVEQFRECVEAAETGLDDCLETCDQTDDMERADCKAHCATMYVADLRRCRTLYMPGP